MKLKIICSWCGVKIGEKDCDVLDDRLPNVTHSICDECKTEVLKDLKQTYNQSRKNKLQITIERRS
jgi:hypothetical protein